MHLARMREFTFLLNGARDGDAAATYRVEVRTRCRAYELARQMLGRRADCTSIDILEGADRLCTVNAGDEA